MMKQMKLIISIFLVTIGIGLGFTSCEQVSVSPYKGATYVSFYDSAFQYRLCVQTIQDNFYYKPASVQRDTAWVKLQIFGNVPSKDCHIKIRAYHNNTVSTLQDLDDAQSGVHFVPFDSEEMQKLLIFHAGKMTDSIPVILLRDPSLKEIGRRLTLRLENSDDILAADQMPDSTVEHTTVCIYTADCLSQPSTWYNYNFFLGTYGQVKHDFIIRHSGKKWDDDFIKSLTTSLQTYYLYKFRNELIVENEERKTKGLDVLKEKDGTPVTFPDRTY